MIHELKNLGMDIQCRKRWGSGCIKGDGTDKAFADNTCGGTEDTKVKSKGKIWLKLLELLSYLPGLILAWLLYETFKGQEALV